MALNIMIVDDSPVMRTFIRKVVGLTGLDLNEFFEAGDGQEALNFLHEHWTDLVLTDINMPRMNGEEFVRRREEDELLRDIRSSSYRRIRVRAGFNACLPWEQRDTSPSRFCRSCCATKWRRLWVCLMIEQNFDHLISETLDTVLETMFFAASLGPAQGVSDEPVLEAGVSFQGAASGTLTVRLSEASARILTASFLGEDEDRLTDCESSLVVCELATMLCGTLASKLETKGIFDLAAPELMVAAVEDDFGYENSLAAQQSCAVESGILTVTLRLGAVRDSGK